MHTSLEIDKEEVFFKEGCSLIRVHATAFRFLKHLIVAVTDLPPACVLGFHVHESHQSTNNLFLSVIFTRQDPLLFALRDKSRDVDHLFFPLLLNVFSMTNLQHCKSIVPKFSYKE